jgi:hypothetical protein
MPLNYPNRSRVLVAPRGAMAFVAQDGCKLVCCLVATVTLTRYFAVSGGTDEPQPHQIFDRHRLLIEEAASTRYDEFGSDECGELILGDGDLRRSEAARLASSMGGDHRRALALMAPRHGAFLPGVPNGKGGRVRTIPW